MKGAHRRVHVSGRRSVKGDRALKRALRQNGMASNLALVYPLTSTPLL